MNTVKVEGGRLTGYTTDGAGCRKALENHGLDFSGRVLLLGNGGAARALAFEIAQERKDPDLTIACRKNSQPKAVALGEELAAFLRQRGDRDFRIGVDTYEELEDFCGYGVPKPEYDLLLNATSVGMYPHAGQSPVSARWWASAGPCSTRCTTRGRQSFSGWPKRPGPPPWEAWRCWSTRRWPLTRSGWQQVRPDDLEALCREARLRRSDFLDEGREEFGWKYHFVRVYGQRQDQRGPQARQAAGQGVLRPGPVRGRAGGDDRIPDLAQFGEEGFREREAQAVEEIAREKSLVVASGGGTVLFPRNVEGFHRGGGEILYLDVPLPALQERLKNDKRGPCCKSPTGGRSSPTCTPSALPPYQAAADRTIDAGAPAIVVARRIAALYGSQTAGRRGSGQKILDKYPPGD